MFYDTAGDGLCSIHKEEGIRALPVSCRNFPRVTLRDPRGAFITLSAFCPTVARLLLAAGDIRIVPAPASLTLDGALEGLDATGVLPPLLREGMLMDLDGYSVWEEEAVGLMNERRYTAAAALAVVSEATGEVIRWCPGRTPLSAAVRRAFADARAKVSSAGPPVNALEHATKAFLASHLFGSWAAYQRGGLGAILEETRTAAGLVQGAHDPGSFVQAVREADLRLRHTAR